MPPKDNKKGGGKKQQLLAQLNALVSTYKAASRNHGVPPLKPLLTELEECIQE
eukprot:CAMPEP_0202907646 /NCGR_PEP_ID=MMETSP1392-20130828/43391_1 /ASSEMBLY_ACC=CAM_ASM_000868 /TAXON_ID=225041 /ORGANISM="Chlamydomonas chlamydogama, Strain SAG 11-48b" /LENGTH=52 /DNA_ID=CAMNT_0049596653 /DNA_START=24 /DNA_END=179 /DNA_ORIENTATION=+